MALIALLAAARARAGGATLALLGAIGFFTRVPVGTEEAAWTAVTERPAAMVVAAYPIGAALALPFVLGDPAAVVGAGAVVDHGAVADPNALELPAVSVAFAFPIVLLGLTGITHLDGLADVGDAAVVHGDVERRRSVLLDTDVGVGALVTVGVAICGLVLAGLGLSTVPLAAAVAVVVAAEVGAKLGMAAVAALAPSLFGTLGSQLEGAGAATGIVAAAFAAPAVLAPALLLDAGVAVAAAGAVLAGPLAALAVAWWAQTRLDGANGDCFGATNEIGRLAGLHAGLWLLAVSIEGAQASVATVGVPP